MDVALVRHGESTVNARHLVPGWSLDAPLTPTGRAQALAAADRVAALATGTVRLVSSDALRARQTAEPIGQALGCSLETDARLREQDAGWLEGKPTSELAELPVPEGADISEIAWGGGESIADVYRRLAEFWERPWEGIDTLVLVGHGDAMRVLRAVVAGVGHRRVDWDRPGLEPGGIETWRV